MSADNVIYVKEILGTWWVQHGFASEPDCGDDMWFSGGKQFKTKTEALVTAHEWEQECGYVEYGVSIL